METTHGRIARGTRTGISREAPPARFVRYLSVGKGGSPPTALLATPTRRDPMDPMRAGQIMAQGHV
jgi:hypothetical protein